MYQSVTQITANGKQFCIKETKMTYGDRVISHTFKLGGDYEDCVDATVFYGPNHQPTHGKIPYIEHIEQCAIGSSLQRGVGTVLMIKTLLRYIHQKHPSVTKFEFDDMSHIECATEQEQQMLQRYQRKKGTKIKPMNLYHFSIAYNDCTWYEKYFGAKLEDATQYSAYRARIQSLTNPEDKVDFIQFLQMAQPPEDQIEYLEPKYKKATTYREFFQSIPKEDRCPILYPWITPFMNKILGGTFTNHGWIIDVTKMNIQQGGKRRGTRKKSTYYLPKGRIVNYTEKHFVTTGEAIGLL